MGDSQSEEIESSQPSRRFWRIVHAHSPSAGDFTSNASKGLPAQVDDPYTLHLHEGISVFDQRRYARRLALRAPFLGRFLAELRVAVDAPIVVERTTKSHGDYTIWGDPEFLLTCVVSVTPVRGVPEDRKVDRMTYALWHLEGGNIIGTWDSEEEALIVVRDALRTHGPRDVRAWALIREDEDPDGEIVTIAEGDLLIARAQAALSAA